MMSFFSKENNLENNLVFEDRNDPNSKEISPKISNLDIYWLVLYSIGQS